MSEMQKWREEVKKMTLQEKLEEMKNLTLELEAEIRDYCCHPQGSDRRMPSYLRTCQHGPG